MSCPFNKESLDKLKVFIELCSKKPELLHLPELSFFKNYLQSIGATLPVVEPMDPGTTHADLDNENDAEVHESVESDTESELEFDTEGCIAPDEVDVDQVMGDSSKVPSEEEIDSADEKRMAAMSEFNEGNYDKSVGLLTEAIVLNPTAAVLFVKRGQAYLKLNKPNACVKDCSQALELNPDSAIGYKFRGRAYRLLGKWEEAAKDLRQACTIDFDEQIDEWLKEVTPNASKIEQHRLKQERKKTEKEQKERLERLRKAKEAHAKAAEAKTEDSTQDQSNLGGATGMGDFYKLFQDPEVMNAFKDPEVAAAFQDISMNPANFIKYQSNPKIMDIISKLSNKFGSGMNFPGGFPGSFPGGGNFGGEPKPSTKLNDDDTLD